MEGFFLTYKQKERGGSNWRDTLNGRGVKRVSGGGGLFDGLLRDVHWMMTPLAHWMMTPLALDDDL